MDTSVPSPNPNEQHTPSPSDPWPELEPFENYTPPSFPIDALPSPLREFTDVMAEAIQASPDSVAMLAIAACSLPCSSIARVSPKHGHVEPAMLWVACAEPPGARKSSVHAAVMRPIRDIETKRRETASAQVHESQSRRRVLEKQVQRAEDAVAKGADGAAGELADALRELEQHEDVHPPQLIVADATIEALADVMHREDAPIGLFSAEGQPFEHAAGIYSKGDHANVGSLLHAHDGEPLVINRRGSEVISVPSARLVAGLAVQPRVVEEIRRNDSLRGRGLVGRWCFLKPTGLVGDRKFDVAVSGEDIERVERDYATLVRELFECSSDVPLDELPIVTLDDEARDRFRMFYEYVESEQRPGGRFDGIEDWASKAHGKVARIALALHLVQRLGRGTSKRINGETMAAAVEIGHYLCAHALAVYAGAAGSPSADRAQRLWLDVVALGEEVINLSKLHRDKAKRRYPNGPNSMAADVAELVRRGYLRRAPWADPANSRRATSPRYEVRP